MYACMHVYWANKCIFRYRYMMVNYHCMETIWIAGGQVANMYVPYPKTYLIRFPSHVG
jgi:hypothetical protein